jgi:hypothetical protein
MVLHSRDFAAEFRVHFSLEKQCVCDYHSESCAAFVLEPST